MASFLQVSNQVSGSCSVFELKSKIVCLRMWSIMSETSALPSFGQHWILFSESAEKSLKNMFVDDMFVSSNSHVCLCMCSCVCIHVSVCVCSFVHVCVLCFFFYCSHIPYSLNVLSLMSTGSGKLDVSVPITTGEC